MQPAFSKVRGVLSLSFGIYPSVACPGSERVLLISNKTLRLLRLGSQLYFSSQPSVRALKVETTLTPVEGQTAGRTRMLN